MRLQLGLDLLHRRIEEWTEAALVEAEMRFPEAEGFLEFGSDLVAFLHEIVEEWEWTDQELMLTGPEASSEELCEELMTALLAAWERDDFEERPDRLRLDELRSVMEAIAEVLESPCDEGDDELDVANDEIEEFLSEAW